MVKLIMQDNYSKSKDIKNHSKNINNLFIDNIKTTNINILLNRVKIDKKKQIVQKFIIFSLILSLFLITSLIVLI